MTEQEALALQDRRLAAMTAKDYGGLAALCHDQLIYTHSHAGVDSKASWLESMSSGRVAYNKATMTDRKARIYGDMVLLTGAGVIEATVGGAARTLKLRFLEGWTKTPQGWKFVAWQSTSLP